MKCRSVEAAVELVILGIELLEIVTFDEIVHSKSVQKVSVLNQMFYYILFI